MNTLLNKHLRNGKTRDLLQSFIKKSIIHYELNLREIQKYISDLSDFFSIANQPLFELYFPVIAVLIVAKRKNRNTDDFLEALNDQVEKTYFLEAMDLFKSTDKDSFIKVYHRILEKTAKYNGLESYRLINREVKEREIFTHIINYIGDIVNINYKDLATEFNSITGFILTNEVLQGNKVPATNQLGE
jgi:cell division protein FtsI/penicillin-binding protein 2